MHEGDGMTGYLELQASLYGVTCKGISSKGHNSVWEEEET